MGKHLTHWATVGEKYFSTEEFIEWLFSKGVEFDLSNVPKESPIPLEHRRWLDEFYEVDRKGIDDERRAILDELATRTALPGPTTGDTR